MAIYLGHIFEFLKRSICFAHHNQPSGGFWRPPVKEAGAWLGLCFLRVDGHSPQVMWGGGGGQQTCWLQQEWGEGSRFFLCTANTRLGSPWWSQNKDESQRLAALFTSPHSLAPHLVSLLPGACPPKPHIQPAHRLPGNGVILGSFLWQKACIMLHFKKNTHI